MSKKLGKKTKLSDGTYLYIEEGKKDSFEAIILNCRSMRKMRKFAGGEDLTTFGNKEALVVFNSSQRGNMWDLLIIEN